MRASPDTASSRPDPPRFRRLRRLTAAGLAVLVLLGGVRVWWGYEASRRLRAEIDAIRARGEPIFPADFDPPAVPPVADAAVAYGAAAAGVVAFPPTATSYSEPGVLPFTPAEMQAVRAWTAANAVPLQRARMARGLPSRDGGMKMAPPVYAMTLPGLNPYRQLGDLLNAVALHSHAGGDDAGAVESLRDLAGLSPVVERQPPLMIGHLVAGSIDDILYSAIDQIAPDLRVEGDAADPLGQASGAKPAAVPAGRGQVKALIVDLLDETAWREGFVRAEWGERMATLDAESSVITGVGAPLGWLLRPAFDLDTARALRRHNQAAAAATAPDFPAAKAMRPAPVATYFTPPSSRVVTAEASSRLEAVTRFPSFATGLTAESAVNAHYRYLAGRRMAAVALAVRLYRADHAGAWPRALAELVPAYLPAMPADPYAADGRPLAYLPVGPAWNVTPADLAAAGIIPPPPDASPFAPGPIVYSVGENGVDDGGSRQRRPGVRGGLQVSFESFAWLDLVVGLEHNPILGSVPIPPPPPPGGSSPPTSLPALAPAGSGETQNHDPDERGGGGKKDEGDDRPGGRQDRQQ